MANLSLGLPDVVIPPEYASSWHVNKIGGTPDWMSASPPPAPVCQLCQRPQMFLLQLYCLLAEHPYHRTIYVFACPSSRCTNRSESWTIVRCQALNTGYASGTAPQEESFADGSWGMEADNWGDDDDDENDDEGNEFPRLGAAATTKIEGNSVWGGYRDNSPSGGNRGSDFALGGDENNSASLRNTQSNPGEVEINGSNSFSGENPRMSLPGATERESVEEATSTMEAMSIDSETDKHDMIVDLLGAKPEESVLGNMLLKKARVEQELGPSVVPVVEGRFVRFVEEEPEYPNSRKREDILALEYSQREGVNFKAMAEESVMNSKKPGKKGGKERGKAQGRDGGDGVYEKAAPSHGDLLFERFIKKTTSCPEQILRYCLEGEPLHISSHQQAPVPECPSCKSARMFEFQMMPALVRFLKPADSKEYVFEFGTVLIYTCSKSCWADDEGYRTEYAVIEADSYDML